MGLYRAHLYHDVPIPAAPDTPTKPCRLFHGLNRLFTVSREMPMYFGPFSTTIAKTVASTFCDERGLIWLIQPSYANPLKVVVGINVDWISGFKHEREVLLYNQCLPIEKTETFDDDSNILMNHFIRSLISRESPIIKKEAFYKQLGVGLDAESMRSICDHDLLFEKTQCNDMRVVDRLVMELGVVGPNMAVKLWNTRHSGKTELEYFVEERKNRQLLDHHQVLTTKFKKLHFSSFLNRTWLRFTGDVNDEIFKLNEYKTNKQSFGIGTTATVKGQVTRIQVKNTKLFGNRFVTLQNFTKDQKQKDLSDNFIDSLSVDRYGFVFVDDIPKKNHQFAIGNIVKCQDDSIRKICELTADQICIEIGDERKWIQRNLVPMEITMTFLHQQDIGKYAFKIFVDDDAKHYSFSDIKKFEIPCPSSKDNASEMTTFEVYVKPKDLDIPFIKIKSIEYRSSDASKPMAPEFAVPTTGTDSIVKQLMVNLKERDSEIKNEIDFLNSFGLKLDDRSEWMENITAHPMLFDVTAYRRKLVIERLIVELNLLSSEWVRRISEQTKDGKSLLDCLVEDRKILRLLDHYQVMRSKFKILHFGSLLNRSWLKLERSNKMQDLEVVADAHYFDENEYKVNDEIFNTTTFSVQGQVSQIEVKNSKLFGESFAILQTFGEKQEQRENASPFIDCLTVDQYGFVFVDDVPKRNHQFKAGDAVKCKDGSRGKICELKTDQICVEIGRGKRWIKKSMIPMEIILSFQHEQDVGKYEFMLRAEVGDGAEVDDRAVVDDGDLKQSDAKLFSFSDFKRFKIPYLLMRNDPSKVYSFGVYAKPKGVDVPVIKIKTIEYPPTDVTELVISNTESIVNHLIVTLKQTRTEIRDATTFLNLFGLHPDDQSKWMYLIINHSMLFDVTAYRKQLVIERLIVELSLLSKEWLQAILKQERQKKPLLDWLVEDRKLLRLLDFYRGFAPKFKLEKYSKLLNCSWLSVQKKKDIEEEFGIKGEDNATSLEKTKHRIDGTLIPFAESAIDGFPRLVTVENANLFVGDEFTVQEFEKKEDETERTTKEDFRDLLSINKFGVISVEATVDRKVQIENNGKWINGVICRQNGNVLCVKTGDNGLFSFQWIEKDQTMTMMKLLPFESEREVNEFDFAARAGVKEDVDNDTSMLKQFNFKDVNEFCIPTNLLVATSSTADAVHIYAKPKDKNMKYHHVKTLENPFDSFSFSRYFVDQKEPFVINKKVKVQHFLESTKCGGEWEVTTSSEIFISQSGGIDASACGSRQKSDSKLVGDGANGGTISLFAGGNVLNKGTILCRASDENMFSGGTLYAVADGRFENNGMIDCGKDGMILIGCAILANNGRITPAPIVVIDSNVTMMSLVQEKGARGRDRRITLQYEKHNQHNSNDHPRNLLEEGTDRYYRCYSSTDWVIFRLDSEQKLFPTKIGIRNANHDRGLKSLSIAGSVDTEHFEEWILIKNIHRQNEELQTFDIEAKDRLSAWTKGFKYFRIEKLENHGGAMWHYMFREFQIYGVSM